MQSRVIVFSLPGSMINEHIAAGLIWASLCAAVLKWFLVHAAQLVGGKPISTRRVAMCAGHNIDEIVTVLLTCVSIAATFREGNGVLACHARRSNLVAIARWDDARADWLSEKFLRDTY